MGWKACTASDTDYTQKASPSLFLQGLLMPQRFGELYVWPDDLVGTDRNRR